MRMVNQAGTEVRDFKGNLYTITKVKTTIKGQKSFRITIDFAGLNEGPAYQITNTSCSSKEEAYDRIRWFESVLKSFETERYEAKAFDRATEAAYER